MKALCWHGKHNVQIDTVPEPRIINKQAQWIIVGLKPNLHLNLSAMVGTLLALLCPPYISLSTASHATNRC